jgi:hypothetical protein
MDLRPELPQWYILKQALGTCAIAPQTARDAVKNWEPFASRDRAIERRIGLIRAGKCQPA